jgi:hypothetical protein
VSRGRQHLSLVVDEVLTAANAATQRKVAETTAVKVAAAQPKTEMARGLRALAAEIRTASDDVSYDDLVGAL